jgi:elongation factor P--(R)-beta-lysine ligase
MTLPSPWWTPTRHEDRRSFLLGRNRIKTAVRSWFDAQGFVEVDPACLQASPGNEIHLNAFKTELVDHGLARRSLYLHTSPEFSMKKLLAAGEEKIFTFTPCFRNRERGALHHPEFTMLEWYRKDAPYTDVIADAAAILRLAAETVDNRFVSFRGRTSNPRTEPERLTVADAFSRYAGIDLLRGLGTDGPDLAPLAAAARDAGITVREGDTWGDVFAKVLTALIEPKLGLGRATLLTEYPTNEAALARLTPHDPRVAQRFELYCCGVELANGFGELTDADEQRRRLEGQMEERARLYGERYPIDEDFIAALREMPPASGCALGFDRLVMLATGAERVEQVIWTPVVET